MSAAPIKLYRQLLRQATRFAGYNFRQYAIRRVRDSFVANRGLTDPAEIQTALENGKKSLGVVTRQALISGLYRVPDLVIEKQL